MTEKNKNSNYKSFLSGENASYLEQMQEKYASTEFKLDKSWKDYFKALNSIAPATNELKTSPSWLRSDWPPSPKGEFLSAVDNQWDTQAPEDLKNKIETKAAETGTAISENFLRQAVLDSIRALMIIRAYRIRGHLATNLDPLGITKKDINLS